VLIDVDSPGGTVNGVPELSDTISRGAQIKPVAAIANSQMASAAYWLGSQVGPGKKRLTAAPSADVGSIGVFRMHEDVSEMLAADGVKVTFLAMPEFKTEANPFEPLTDAAIEHHMGQVEATYDQFVSAVASGRGVPKSAVKERYGKGRMFHASQAADMGLVDRVASLPQLLAEFGGTLNQLEHAEADVLRDEICHAWECGQLEPITSGDVLLQRQKLRLKQKT
jgi:signal peptide peptidase SppA